MTRPTEAVWLALSILRGHLLTACEAVAAEGRPDMSDAARERLAAALSEQVRRIQGNRPNSAPATWEDARLILVSTLRSALRTLGEEAPE